MITRRTLLAGCSAAVLVLAACGGDDDAGPSTEAPAEQEITIEGAWARTSPAMTTAGAAYMVITSSVDDTLVGASVDASIAADAQIHETVMAEGEMSEDTMAMSDDTMTTFR